MRMNQKSINEVKNLISEEKFQESALKIHEYISNLDNSWKCEGILGDLLDIDEDYILAGRSIYVNAYDIYLESKYDWNDLDHEKYYYVKYIRKDGELYQIVEDLNSENLKMVIDNVKKHLKTK